MGRRILAPNESVFSGLNVCTKFHQTRVKIATVGARRDRETDRRTQVIL